jgi:two-component system, OmpR family, alkaline phosphatase synthesis response regulator PhoP
VNGSVNYLKIKNMLKKPKILIVDDDKGLLEMYQYFFEKEGFEVFSETDGLRGVSKAVEVRPDIILVDIMMPQMNGLETIVALRKNTDLDFVIIAFSNIHDHSQIKKCIDYGANGFLVKSETTPRDVLEEVKKFLENTFTFPAPVEIDEMRKGVFLRKQQ